MRLRRTGFTLVEVTVASTLGAFVMLVAVGTLKAITSSAEMVDRNINAAAEVRFASNMIKKDLVNLYRDEDIENTKLIGTVEDSGQGSTSYLVFYSLGRTKARADEPEGDIYEVEYYLVKDEETSALMRRLWPNPNEEFEPGGILSVIAEDIDLFEVTYFDGEEWSDEWPEEMEVLPDLIEITIVGKLPSSGEPTMESYIVNLTRSVSAGSTGLEGSAQEQSDAGITTQSSSTDTGAGTTR